VYIIGGSFISHALSVLAATSSGRDPSRCTYDVVCKLIYSKSYEGMKVQLYILGVTKLETSVIMFRFARINKVMQLIWPVNARGNSIWPCTYIPC
jgi:hypothetical protein